MTKSISKSPANTDVGERIGEHLLDLISGGDGEEQTLHDLTTGGGKDRVDFVKATWRKAF